MVRDHLPRHVSFVDTPVCLDSHAKPPSLDPSFTPHHDSPAPAVGAPGRRDVPRRRPVRRHHGAYVRPRLCASSRRPSPTCHLIHPTSTCTSHRCSVTRTCSWTTSPMGVTTFSSSTCATSPRTAPPRGTRAPTATSCAQKSLPTTTWAFSGRPSSACLRLIGSALQRGALVCCASCFAFCFIRLIQSTNPIQRQRGALVRLRGQHHAREHPAAEEGGTPARALPGGPLQGPRVLPHHLCT